MTVQDRRIEAAIRTGVDLALGAAKAPLEKHLGDPIAWVWEQLGPELAQAIADGILRALGELGLASGRVRVVVSEGATVSFELLPPKE